MGEYLPRFMPGQKITYTAGADIEAGVLVELSADRTVIPATAGSTKVIGVIGPKVKNGSEAVVFHVPGHVHIVKATGTIAAGAKVQAGASGTVAAGTTAPIGIALKAAADGAFCEFLGQ